MLVAAVTGVDDRNPGFGSGYHGSTLFGMAHGTDISVAGNDADGIGNALTFGSRAGIGRRKTKYTAPEIEHCGFKA